MTPSLSISEAAVLIGVSVCTLRRWEAAKYFSANFRTKGGHRRYLLSTVHMHFPLEPNHEERLDVGYARVSSHDQKEDLTRQAKRVQEYLEGFSCNHEVIEDLGSGLNYKKKGLNRLIQMICQNKVATLVLTHRDRLLRFGSQLLFRICELHGTKVEILDDPVPKSFEEELAADVIEIITVFSARLYGQRSHRKRKLTSAA